MLAWQANAALLCKSFKDLASAWMNSLAADMFNSKKDCTPCAGHNVVLGHSTFRGCQLTHRRTLCLHFTALPTMCGDSRVNRGLRSASK